MNATRRFLNTVPGLAVAFGVAGGIGGLASLGTNFLGFAVFGAVCGLALGLTSDGGAKRLGIMAVAGAVGFIAGIALATVLGMTIGLSLGPSPWYSVAQSLLIGGAAGFVAGISLVWAAGWSTNRLLAAVAMATGFGLAALINEEWLLPVLRTETLSLLPLAVWGLLGGLGIGLARRYAR
jgi:hypothetical protein